MEIQLKENERVLPESPSRWTAEEFNQIIQELQNVLTAFSVTPNAVDVT